MANKAKLIIDKGVYRSITGNNIKGFYMKKYKTTEHDSIVYYTPLSMMDFAREYNPIDTLELDRTEQVMKKYDRTEQNRLYSLAKSIRTCN